jgi:hypothetical protein
VPRHFDLRGARRRGLRHWLSRTVLAGTLGSVIEITRFRLNDATSVEDFVAVNAKYQTDFAYQQVGLRRRTVAPGLDGEWLSLTFWGSKADAHRANEEAAHSSVAQAFAACMETSSKTVEYFKELAG